MGWYDAFKGDAARVNMSAVTSNSGSAAKNFGDAFQEIGKSMLNVDEQRKKDELVNQQLENEKFNKEVTQYNFDQKQANDNQKSIDDAFGQEYMQYKTQKEFDQHVKDDNIGGFQLASQEAKVAQQKYFKEQDDIAKVKFNNEAMKLALGFENYKDFIDNNPEVSKNADGHTLKGISDYYDTKDTRAKDLKAAEAMAEMKKQVRIAQINAAKASAKAASKTEKPLTIAEQKSLDYLITKDNFVTDGNGKVVLDDKDQPTLKDGISPAYNEFVTNAVNKYMTVPGSDRNYKNARAAAIAEWKSLPDDSEEKLANAEQLKEEPSWLSNMFGGNSEPIEPSKDNVSTKPTSSDNITSSLMNDFIKSKNVQY